MKPEAKRPEPLTFTRCVLACWQNEDFMREYRRLSGHRLGGPMFGEPRNPSAIDQAIGRACHPVLDPNEARAFFDFVRDHVWIPVLQKMVRETKS